VYHGFFDLDEISDVRARANVRAGTQPRKRSDLRARADAGAGVASASGALSAAPMRQSPFVKLMCLIRRIGDPDRNAGKR